VMLVSRKGNINNITVSVLHYCVGLLLYWCTKLHIRAVLTGRATVSGFDLAWFSSIFRAPVCLWTSWFYIQ